jgi:hypothetical protein
MVPPLHGSELSLIFQLFHRRQPCATNSSPLLIFSYSTTPPHTYPANYTSKTNPPACTTPSSMLLPRRSPAFKQSTRRTSLPRSARCVPAAVKIGRSPRDSARSMGPSISIELAWGGIFTLHIDPDSSTSLVWSCVSNGTKPYG